MRPDTRPINLDFPSPNVTNSYHNPDHVAQIDNPIHIYPKPTKPQSQINTQIKEVDPTQFLPAFNPNIAKGENPLQKTPPENIGLERTVENLDPEVKKYIDAMNDLSFQVC